jgi:signal transduction histidine kinase
MEAGLDDNRDEALRGYLATAKREVSAATLIVSDLLDFAASRGPMAAPVDVAELVAEALSVVPPPPGIEVVDLCEPNVIIDADRDQIRQVLLNLITNGFDAMPAGGVLTVTATPLSGTAQIIVHDTGEGMDEQTCGSIFTPFYTKKSRGIGLGLAVTRRIVESHGGTITVESTPSVGSSFTVSLPGVVAMASVAP